MKLAQICTDKSIWSLVRQTELQYSMSKGDFKGAQYPTEQNDLNHRYMGCSK